MITFPYESLRMSAHTAGNKAHVVPDLITNVTLAIQNCNLYL